jgi:superfamily I DNA and/or RNA helicase
LTLKQLLPSYPLLLPSPAAGCLREAVLVRGWRVLLVAPSNVAVDNLLQRLLAAAPNAQALALAQAQAQAQGGVASSSSRRSGRRVNAVRVGHPARASADVLAHCLDARLATADGACASLFVSFL